MDMETKLVQPTQLKTRLSWVLSMIALGATDTILNIINAEYFSKSGLNRCVVIGPPTLILWIFQVLFVAIGFIFFILELINSITVFLYEGERNLIPIHLELLVTLPAKHIPLAATNYFTAKCRERYATPLQQTLAALQIAYIFVRMLWYAHIEGKKLKKNEKYKIQRGFFMLICVLFSCSMVFSIMLWKDQNNIKLQDHHMKNVSIYFLNLPGSLQHRLLNNEQVDDVVEAQGYTVNRPFLVSSLLGIHNAGDYGYNITYTCHQNETMFLPEECHTNNFNKTPAALSFRFVFNPNAPVCHMGEVVYNYAQIFGEDPGNQTCVPSTADFHGGWDLSYYYTIKTKHQNVRHLDLTSPWLGTCVIPVPTYEPHMVSIC